MNDLAGLGKRAGLPEERLLARFVIDADDPDGVLGAVK
jgi:hypothetical protein